MEEKLPPVINLGGRSFTLRMTHNVLMLFSQITKTSLEQMQYQVGRYDYMVLLLWLMCHEQNSQLKRETFDRWLNEAGIRGVIPLITAVGEAMQAAFPDTDEDESAPAEAEAAADPT